MINDPSKASIIYGSSPANNNNDKAQDNDRNYHRYDVNRKETTDIRRFEKWHWKAAKNNNAYGRKSVDAFKPVPDYTNLVFRFYFLFAALAHLLIVNFYRKSLNRFVK